MTIYSFIRFAVLVVALFSSPAAAQEKNALELLNEGEFQRAREALLIETQGNSQQSLFLLLLEALVQRKVGNSDLAIHKLRSLLAQNPGFEPARTHLVSALTSTGQQQKALYHINYLARSSHDPLIRRQMSNRLYRIAGKQRGVSLSFSIIPSSNANKGTQNETVLIGGVPFKVGDGSLAQPGIKLNFGVQSWRNWLISETNTLLLIGRANVKLGEYTEDTEKSAFVESRVQHRMQAGEFSTGLVAEATYTGNDLFRYRTGLKLSSTHTIAPDRHLNTVLTHWRQRYPEEEYRNGTKSLGEISITRNLSRSTKITLGVPFEIERTKRAHLDHNDIGLRLALEKQFSQGLNLGLEVGVRSNRYLGEFPGTAVKRKDLEKQIAISFSHKKFKIGAHIPKIRYEYTRVNSNIGFYESDSHDVFLGFSKLF